MYSIFKDLLFYFSHQNRMSQELVCLGQVMYLTYFITFVTKFVPSWHEAKDQFIREHRGTVFKTRQQAVVFIMNIFSAVKHLLKGWVFFYLFIFTCFGLLYIILW